MITHYKYQTLGGADYGWLQAKYHFSFASYHDPRKMSFGELLVINDDIIQPGTGFDTHSHDNMEIITYVRRGAISHRDSKGNRGRTAAGNIQVMSAGTGIRHSEHNLEDEATNLFQIWISPRERNVTPRWDMAEFPGEPATDRLPLLVSGDGKAPLMIHQDARIYAGAVTAGTVIKHRITGQAYVLASDGRFLLDDITANRGDGMAVTGQDAVTIKAETDCEILVIEVPGKRRAR